MVTRPARLAIESRSLAFEPHVENLPDLPPVDWQAGPFRVFSSFGGESGGCSGFSPDLIAG